MNEDDDPFISDCKRYRYRLERKVLNGDPALHHPIKRVAFFGINPSTATAFVDDHTIRKLKGFAFHNGHFDILVVGNAFAARATNVKDLAIFDGAVGPKNDSYLRAIMSECDLLVPCWGNRSKVPGHLQYRFGDMRRLLRESKKPVKVFGLTQTDDPMHPLMLPYSTKLQEWAP